MTTATNPTDQEKTFQEGDVIKFQAIAGVEETAHWMLPKSRENVFIQVSIVEKNGQPLSEPVSLECGIYRDELPPEMDLFWQGDQLQIKGLDAEKFWTAGLKGGMARAKAEDRGTWVPNPSGAYIVGSTLRMTDELAPTHVEPGAKTAAAVQEKQPSRKDPIQKPWYMTVFKK